MTVVYIPDSGAVLPHPVNVPKPIARPMPTIASAVQRPSVAAANLRARCNMYAASNVKKISSQPNSDLTFVADRTPAVTRMFDWMVNVTCWVVVSVLKNPLEASSRFGTFGYTFLQIWIVATTLSTDTAHAYSMYIVGTFKK